MNYRSVLLSMLLLAAPLPALAGSFASDKAEVMTSGMECKKADVQISDSKIIVDGGKRECKNIGFAKTLDQLTDISWDAKAKSVSFQVKDGDSYTITVKKKAEFEQLKAALVSMM